MTKEVLRRIEEDRYNQAKLAIVEFERLLPAVSDRRNKDRQELFGDMFEVFAHIIEYYRMKGDAKKALAERFTADYSSISRWATRDKLPASHLHIHHHVLVMIQILKEHVSEVENSRS